MERVRVGNLAEAATHGKNGSVVYSGIVGERLSYAYMQPSAIQRAAAQTRW
jgi:hypothetical protein